MYGVRQYYSPTGCRGNIILGFEQCNKYTILNEAGETVALLAEDVGGLGSAVGRQLLRTRRSLTATVLSPDGGLHFLSRVWGLTSAHRWDHHPIP